MGKKYKGVFKKGTKVFVKNRSWRTNEMVTDTKNIFQIRNIGLKMATLDYCHKENDIFLSGRRGTQFFIYPEGDGVIRSDGSSLPVAWEELFVIAGEPGWDF